MNAKIVPLSEINYGINNEKKKKHIFFAKLCFLPSRVTGQTGDSFCKFITGSGILWTCSTASGFLLIAIAVERCTSRQVQNQRTDITTARLKGVVAFCWIPMDDH